ncbi:T9SS type A sorting domain-containing protein [Taibaiella lutea]|uniref:T9SS type A sorting domain-containing protein n=1 Tax=Taibaiella lutea TaxID=2608001 RepID=A0A5M6CHI8_9BACT|nr:T9SS type A sorting domain-containing protein [Taibaiella lutea]KAA5534668.1 T9SS type A sorting domain-containing protein [Taibaiella lutea]
MKKKNTPCLSIIKKGLTITLIAAFLWPGQVFAQDTLLLSPTGDGGFENGMDFASNGWTVENYTANNTNKWAVGGASAPTQGTMAAYISNNNGTNYTYTTNQFSRVLFWRDITFPAGYTVITLTFKVKVQGEYGGTATSYYDVLFPFFQSSNTAPSVTQPAYSSSNSQPAISNATRIASLTELGTGYVTRTYTLNAGNAAAATTRRLLFYWRNDNTGGAQPPASIDEISITATMPPVNDNATGAIMLTPGAGCGTFYDNTLATANTGEPTASCSWHPTRKPIWFKFIAPASGAARISSDNGGTLISTRMALFTATDSSNYTTFNIIHCSRENGVTAAGNNIMYPTGLTPGATYYIALDVYDAATSGTVCITVDEFNNTMLSTTTADCVAGKVLDNTGAQNYNGWISLTDNQGKLNANVRPVTGYDADFSSSLTVKSGAPRTDINGQAYLNRNYLINSSDPIGTGLTSADVQFFFTDAELTNLGVSLSGLNVTRVSGTTCSADFMDGTGTNSLLTQTANGSFNGVHYIQVNTPGFSNFYIHQGTTPLPIVWNNVSVTLNRRQQAVINWSVAEKETAEYRIEKSVDGNKFENLSTLKSKGNGNNTYSFTEQTALSGKAWYRIVQVSKEGKGEYSRIMELQNSNIYGLISVYPNPATQVLTVETASNASYNIYDLQGKVIMKGNLQSGKNTLNVSGIAKGFYTIKIGDYNQKIVLQ